jgi:hypothetical protein
LLSIFKLLGIQISPSWYVQSPTKNATQGDLLCGQFFAVRE